jgi:hypothetical protein
VRLGDHHDARGLQTLLDESAEGRVVVRDDRAERFRSRSLRAWPLQ